MDLPDNLKPPAWAVKPSKLAESLNHAAYYSSEFDDAVSVSDSNAFAGGVRQFLYWKRQLAPSISPLSVMFALLGATGLVTLNVINVMTGAIRAFCLSKAIECSQGANSQFLAVSFRTSEDAILFRNSFKYFENAVVAYVTPMAERSYRYSLLWLPPLFQLDKVRGLLRRFSHSFDTQRGSTNIGGGQFLPSSVIRGTLSLKEGVDIESLPHLVPLPPPHLGFALLIIDGREPFCLKCLHRGHLRRVCPRPRCNLCKFFHFADEICDRATYASKVAKTAGHSEPYCWTDDVGVDHDAPSFSDVSVTLLSDASSSPCSIASTPTFLHVQHTSASSEPVTQMSDDIVFSKMPTFPTSCKSHSGGDILSSPECIHVSPASASLDLVALDSVASPVDFSSLVDAGDVSIGSPSLSEVLLPEHCFSIDSSPSVSLSLVPDDQDMLVESTTKVAGKRSHAEASLTDGSGSEDFITGPSIPKPVSKRDRCETSVSGVYSSLGSHDPGGKDYTRCPSDNSAVSLKPPK